MSFCYVLLEISWFLLCFARLIVVFARFCYVLLGFSSGLFQGSARFSGQESDPFEGMRLVAQHNSTEQGKKGGLSGPLDGVNRGLNPFKRRLRGLFLEISFGKLIKHCPKKQCKNLQTTSPKLLPKNQKLEINQSVKNMIVNVSKWLSIGFKPTFKVFFPKAFPYVRLLKTSQHNLKYPPNTPRSQPPTKG